MRARRRAAGLAERCRRTAELLRIFVPREIRTRYRQSAFNAVWALISPIAVLVVYGLVLTQSFSVESACSPYLSSAWLGLVMWTYFATAVGGATFSLVSSSDLVTKVYFPRETLPLSVVGAALLDLGIGAALSVVVVVWQGVPLTRTAVAAFAGLAVLVVWSAVIAVAAAVMSVFAGDVLHVVQLVLRVGFFATPVMYEPSFLPRAFAWSADVNPLAVAIGGVRDAVLCGTWPNWSLVGAHLGIGLVAFVGVIAYTRTVESRIADVV